MVLQLGWHLQIEWVAKVLIVCGDIQTVMKSCVGMALHEELLLADRQEVVKDLALFNRSSSERLCCCCCCSSVKVD